MKLNVLVGCEESGTVRRALRNLGHNAWSCDLVDSRDRSPYHVMTDIRVVLGMKWDLGIFFPPCTHLCVSGARWFKDKKDEQKQAVEFFMMLANANIRHIAIENPVGIMSTKWRKPNQIIQPWQFGHGETKATCIWLKNLPPLQPTNIVEGRKPRIHHMAPGPNRSRDRSETYEGIANAMAIQWSKYVLQSMGAAPYGRT